MKSKWLFIFIGVVIVAGAVMYKSGVREEYIILLTGAAILVSGIATLIMEMKWRGNSAVTTGRVAGYFEYTEGGTPSRITMYTMEVEYTTAEGKTLRSREQSGSSSKKYPEGTMLKVRYSREDPDLFIVEGDNSRIYAMIGTIAAGVIVAAIALFALKNNM